ncbi:MAG: 2-dehydropantoate 2-reductase [Candidatus Dormibacteraeota bacterium]|nr:2-dehydropantoate 2-reductase [Candidatus Dormibacteraeota bacterium]
MKFAVVGAGAIGGWLGARLAHAGLDVTLVARGAHLDAMRTKGVTVLEPDGQELVARPDCTDDLGSISSADAVFVTVKAHGLPRIAPELGSAVKADAMLVFAQNGIPWWYFLGLEEGRRLTSVDPGLAIAHNIAPRHVVGCVVYPATSVVAPGVIRHEEGNRLTLAEPDGSRSERLQALARELVRAGLKAPISGRIREEIWLKLVGNATLNPLSALTRASLGGMLADPGMRALTLALMQEVQAVAHSLGVRLPLDVEHRLQGASELGDHRTSMLQDVEAGRPLEVEALVGSVVELAAQAEVPVPSLRTVYELTRALDRALREPREPR